MPHRPTVQKPAPVSTSSRLATAATIVYLREASSHRVPQPQPAQCRDLHAALMLSRHLAEAGYVVGESIILAPDPRRMTDQLPPPVGAITDFDFDPVDLVVQTTRPCLDDWQGQTRKPKYESHHAIEQDINGSLRRIFAWLCRERVSLSDAIPLAQQQAWLRNLAFGLYHKRQDSLAEATRWTPEGKQVRLPGTTFGYIAFLRRLDQIQKPFLGVFGMSRDDTFRLACSLDRFPGLIADVLSSSHDRIVVVQMQRPVDGGSLAGNVRIARDYHAELVLN